MVASHTHQSENLGSVFGMYESTQVGQFIRLKSSMFTGSKVDKDPQGFIDKLEKIF